MTLESYHYDPFGNARIYDTAGQEIAESGVGNTFMFTGREYDAESGYYYFRNRYYDPAMGRFTTRDPLGIWGDPANLGNPYTYCGNNPLKYLDPFGLITRAEQYVKDGKVLVDGDNVTRNPDYDESTGKQQAATNKHRQKTKNDAAMVDNMGKAADVAAGMTPVGEAAEWYENIAACWNDPSLTNFGILAMGAVTDGYGRMARKADNLSDAAKKAINLPAWKKLTIDMEHILTRHTVNGAIYKTPGCIKTAFPSSWTEKEIRKAIEEAYKKGKNVYRQGEKVVVQGSSNGMLIEMWVNTKTNIVETAYPK